MKVRMDNLRKKILKKYQDSPFLHRNFIAVRSDRRGFAIVERLIPKKGIIVDLGCGHGYFSHYLALKGPKRKIVGIDNDFRKIEIAKNSNDNKNIRFMVGDITKSNLPSADVFVILNVLYQLPDKKKELIIQNTHKKLKKGGLLIFREDEGLNLTEKLKETFREMFVISFWRRKFSLKLYYPKKNYFLNLLKKYKFKNIVHHPEFFLAKK